MERKQSCGISDFKFAEITQHKAVMSVYVEGKQLDSDLERNPWAWALGPAQKTPRSL